MVFAFNARRSWELVGGDDGGRQERYIDDVAECFEWPNLFTKSRYR